MKRQRGFIIQIKDLRNLSNFSPASTNRGEAKQGITANGIKRIASIAMILDHIGYLCSCAGPREVAVDFCRVLRAAGRISFPLFCFLLAEGMQRTTSVNRYISRLLLCAAISQYPYTLFFGRGKARVLKHEFASIGLWVLCVISAMYLYIAVADRLRFSTTSCLILCLLMFSTGCGDAKLSVLFTYVSAALLIISLSVMSVSRIPVMIGVGAAILFGRYFSYGTGGIIFPAVLWLFRDNRTWQSLSVVSWAIMEYSDCPLFSFCAATSAVCVLLYTGERGDNVFPKGFSYWLYPGHLLLLSVLRDLFYP